MHGIHPCVLDCYAYVNIIATTWSSIYTVLAISHYAQMYDTVTVIHMHEKH